MNDKPFLYYWLTKDDKEKMINCKYSMCNYCKYKEICLDFLYIFTKELKNYKRGLYGSISNVLYFYCYILRNVCYVCFSSLR